jgi:SAM-dependent methyltransferase
VSAAANDLQTRAYFDAHTPEWRSDRYLPMLRWLQDHAAADQSLIDIGCGTGNILQFIQQHTPLRDLAGIDITSNYLDQARQNVGCQTYLGSVLDDQLCREIGPRHDYAVMGAVLHHLVGPTRRISFANARRAVVNALALLKPGGRLLIYEPAHYPAFAMWGVFWLKRTCSAVAPRRLELGRKWLNFGLPVVSYFTNEQLLALFAAAGNIQVVDKQYNDPKKLGLGLRRTSSTFVLQKSTASTPGRAGG